MPSTYSLVKRDVKDGADKVETIDNNDTTISHNRRNDIEKIIFNRNNETARQIERNGEKPKPNHNTYMAYNQQEMDERHESSLTVMYMDIEFNEHTEDIQPHNQEGEEEPVVHQATSTSYQSYELRSGNDASEDDVHGVDTYGNISTQPNGSPLIDTDTDTEDANHISNRYEDDLTTFNRSEPGCRDMDFSLDTGDVDDMTSCEFEFTNDTLMENVVPSSVSPSTATDDTEPINSVRKVKRKRSYMDLVIGNCKSYERPTYLKTTSGPHVVEAIQSKNDIDSYLSAVLENSRASLKSPALAYYDTYNRDDTDEIAHEGLNRRSQYSRNHENLPSKTYSMILSELDNIDKSTKSYTYGYVNNLLKSFEPNHNVKQPARNNTMEDPNANTYNHESETTDEHHSQDTHVKSLDKTVKIDSEPKDGASEVDTTRVSSDYENIKRIRDKCNARLSSYRTMNIHDQNKEDEKNGYNKPSILAEKVSDPIVIPKKFNESLQKVDDNMKETINKTNDVPDKNIKEIGVNENPSNVSNINGNCDVEDAIHKVIATTITYAEDSTGEIDGNVGAIEGDTKMERFEESDDDEQGTEITINLEDGEEDSHEIDELNLIRIEYDNAEIEKEAECENDTEDNDSIDGKDSPTNITTSDCTMSNISETEEGEHMHPPYRYEDCCTRSIDHIFQELKVDNSFQLLEILSLMDCKRLEETLLLHLQLEKISQHLKKMVSYSILEQPVPAVDRDNRYYEMHTDIQQAIRTRINDPSIHVSEIITMISSYKKSISNELDTSHAGVWVHHLAYIINNYYTNDSVMSILENAKYDFYQELRNKESFPLVHEILQMYVQYEDRVNHESKSSTRQHIASEMMRRGEYTNAKTVFVELHGIQTKEYGNRHVKVLRTKSHIALCTMKNGNYEDAIKLFQDLRDIQKETLGERHQSTITTKNNLVLCIMHTGDYDLAHTLFVELFAIQKELYGEDHIVSLTTKYNIARCSMKKGEYEDARNLYQQVYDIQAESLGEKHPCSLVTKNNIALCTMHSGKYNLAQTAFMELFVTQKLVFGRTHPETLKTKNNIAFCLMKIGDFVNAQKLFLEVCDVKVESLGARHPSTLLTKNNMARCYNDQGDSEKTVELLLDIYNTRRTVLGENHPDTLYTKRLFIDKVNKMIFYCRSFSSEEK